MCVFFFETGKVHRHTYTTRQAISDEKKKSNVNLHTDKYTFKRKKKRNKKKNRKSIERKTSNALELDAILFDTISEKKKERIFIMMF